MTLVASPPSILGGSIPHPGLAPGAIQTLQVNGWDNWGSNLGDALVDASIQFRIDGTSTVTLVVEDDHRVLLRSQLMQQKAYLMIDTVGFVTSQIRKRGPQLVITFDHEVVAQLNKHTDTVVVAADTTTRTGFCRRLAAAEPWIIVTTPEGDSPGNVMSQLTVGNVDPSTGLPAAPTIATVSEIPESYWDAMGKVLNEIGWRRFPRGNNELWLVADDYLYAQNPAYTLDESSPGVDTIDFDYDTRKPLSTLKIQCRAEAWAFPVGTIIAVSSCGIANGKWLVTDISRSLLSPTATVTCDQPQATIPEPQPASTGADSASAQVAAALGTTIDPSLSGSTPLPSATGAKANALLGQQMAAARGWIGNQWVALNNVAMAESGWNERAKNPSSAAYGIPQSLPGSKMASAGADWQTNPRTQIQWMLDYIAGRYHDPVGAWQFHLAHGWY